ncbi:MAG TPA: hypothetical protein VFG38_09875 [Pseudomonadales bacterium]|nr:hypothetical protein [Pseudomonadales bacterium]
MSPSKLPLTVVYFLFAFVALDGCRSPQGVSQEAVFQTPHGVAVVDTFTTIATVTGIDATTRKVTMTLQSGKSSTYTAAKGVDLSRFRIGEQIGVQLMDEMALSIKSSGAPARDAVATSFASAADAGSAAVFEGESMEASATVTAINASARTITFQLADGTTKTMKAHSGVDMAGLTVGDTVVVKYAVALVVAIANA